MLDFVAWVKRGYLTSLRCYAVFRGRSARDEFWAFSIAMMILYVAAACLDGLVGLTGSAFTGFRRVNQVFHALPCLSLLVRRLHDLDHRGWWVFWPPIWGAMYRARGTPDVNRFGSAEPRGRVFVPQASAPGEHGTGPSSRDLGDWDGEAAIETLTGLTDTLRSANWFLLFWFGLWIGLFGAMLLAAGILTAPNAHWWLAVVIGILCLGVGISLLRNARVRFRGGRN